MEQKPTPEPDAALDSERARKTWIPQFELDGAAWADFVLGETEFADRFDRYRTGADMLLGEILRYGALGAESDAAMLTEVYARVATDNVVLRHDIYGHVAAFVEDGVIGAVAFLPFVRCDPDRSISAMAVIDYVSMGTLIDGDPMSRVKDITAMIAHGDPKNRGAAFGALLYLGDQRVCDLLLPLRDGLTDAEVREVVGCSTGFLSASSIEFLLDWLEQVEGDERYGRFGIVAGGLGYARRTMQVPVVGTGERPFPAKDIAIEELRRMRREISIEDYTKRIAPRMRAIERAETEPKVMPQIMAIWGVSASGKQEEGAKESRSVLSGLWGLFSKASASFVSARARQNRAARQHTVVRAGPRPSPDPVRPTDSVRQGASENWVPQFESNPEAWAKLTVGTAEFSDRSDGYRTKADMLLGEVVRLGVYGNVAVLNPLYGQLIAGGLGVALRRDVYGYVTALQREGRIHPVAFLPFACWDPDRSISAKAVVDYLSTGHPVDGDPLTRVKEMIGFMTAGDVIENRGAVFGGLLYLGDPRVCSLLSPLRDSLTREEVLDATLCCTGLLHASSVEFLLAWLEEMPGDRRDSFFAPVAAGLGLLRKTMREPFVSTGERAFPITSVTPEEQDRMARKVSIEAYTQTIAPRLRALAWTEPVSKEDPGLKVMPEVLAFWGVAPLRSEETGAWKH